MLVSHRKKFIYTKTVKTAGTSVESFFERYCMAEGEWKFAHHRDGHVCRDGIIGYRGPDSVGQEWFNHMSALDIKKNIGDSVWNSYFKFCVVRNPYDKLVSWFYFQLHKGLITISSDDEIVDAFRDSLARGVPLLDRDKYVIDGKLCIDFAIRFEELEKGIEQVCRRLAIPLQPKRIPRLKMGIRNPSVPLSDFYSVKLIKSVEETYEFEMREFGYRYIDDS